tara:strand:- start:852 stop:1064 length:213 start_codon:yes stop_codon:yes gene_type:complete
MTRASRRTLRWAEFRLFLFVVLLGETDFEDGIGIWAIGSGIGEGEGSGDEKGTELGRPSALELGGFEELM